MANKKTTFADEANRIKNRYYKSRKPGEDSMTDEAFNREMKALMIKQEAIKPKEDNQEFANGGNLPKYQYPNDTNGFSNFLQNTDGPRVDGLSVGSYNPNVINTMTPKSFTSQLPEVNMNLASNPVGQLNSPTQVSQYNPTANILGPLLTTGTNLIASGILKKNANRRKNELLSNIGTNLGRVDAQQIDLGRERANIKSNQALSEATGRYMSKNAQSASEAARIANMARLGSQRTAGDLLSRSYQTEELKNAEMRQRAEEMNRQLAAQERQSEQQQRMAIEQQYGDVPAQINADLARTTGATIQNYLTENRQMRNFYDQANMLNPNYQLDFQQEYQGLTPFQQRMARLGIRDIKPTKRLT